MLYTTVRSAMNKKKLPTALISLSLAASVVTLTACAPSPEPDAYGSPDARAELSVIADDTLKSQVNGEGGQVFIDVPSAQSDDLANITFSAPAFCNADGGIEKVISAIEADNSADLVFARGSIIDELEEKGYVDGNATALNIAEIPVLDNVYLVAARYSANAGLPDTRLIGGDDNAQSGEWRLAYLPDWNGTIAACSDSTLEGQAFNQALGSVGLYDNEDGVGGSYAESIASKITVFETGADALEAVRSGIADIAFVYTFDIDDSAGAEAFYEVPTQLYKLRPNYKGAVVSTSEDKSAARWYLNVMYKLI